MTKNEITAGTMISDAEVFCITLKLCGEPMYLR